jgi:hypothetical protein
VAINERTLTVTGLIAVVRCADTSLPANDPPRGWAVKQEATRMRQIRRALTIVGGAALTALLLGVAAFAFSAAVQPAFLATPNAIVVGFAGAADAQPSVVPAILTGVSAAGTATRVASPSKPKSVGRTQRPAASGSPRRARRTAAHAAAVSGGPATDSGSAPGTSPGITTDGGDHEAAVHGDESGHESSSRDAGVSTDHDTEQVESGDSDG